MSKDLMGGLLAGMDMSRKDCESFVNYLEKVKPDFPFRILLEALGPQDFLKFLDVFSGRRLNFPKKRELIKFLGYLKVYDYCKSRGFTQLAKQQASKLFNRRIISVQRVCHNVAKVMGEPYNE